MEGKEREVKKLQKKGEAVKIELEATKTLVESLESEKKHLQLSLSENKALKEQFREKSERLEQEHALAFAEAQEYKK